MPKNTPKLTLVASDGVLVSSPPGRRRASPARKKLTTTLNRLDAEIDDLVDLVKLLAVWRAAGERAGIGELQSCLVVAHREASRIHSRLDRIADDLVGHLLKKGGEA